MAKAVFNGSYLPFLKGAKVGKGEEHYVFAFPNSYGASIIWHRPDIWCLAEGFELAILQDGHLCYSTEITDDVIFGISAEEVNDLLERIMAL